MSLRTAKLADVNALAMPESGVAIAWLGQAGFLIAGAGRRVVIDPYLSDSLADKYHGTQFPHVRMMPPPVSPEFLAPVDLLFCTHGHTDHMDPGTIPGLLRANPDCRVIAPRAERERALERGVPEDRLLLIDAGDTLDFDGICATATASAHEKLERDTDGNCMFLGYALDIGGVKVWHSGDTVPFPALGSEIEDVVDLALLPINGRDLKRASNGVPGNLTLGEALALSDRVGARALVCHHFGLFDFNTADPTEAQATIDQSNHATQAVLAQTGVSFQLEMADAAAET